MDSLQKNLDLGTVYSGMVVIATSAFADAVQLNVLYRAKSARGQRALFKQPFLNNNIFASRLVQRSGRSNFF
jgi:hypothetical protein